MATGKEPKKQDLATGKRADRASARKDGPKPEWADGLRKLYDEIVDEPLPDSFKDLLSRLDDPIEGGKS